MTAIDPLRHLSVFSPEQFGDTPVHVIGVGATGSNIALEIAKLGVKNLSIWDFDHVEGHNLANQKYGPQHIGMPKVEACADVIKQQTGLEVTTHNEKVTADHRHIIGGHVFLLVDSMAGRKEIGEDVIWKGMRTEQCIETRMGVEHFDCYAFRPRTMPHFKAWQATLYSDEDVAADVTNVNGCNAQTTVGATAAMTSSLAVWQFLNHVRGEEYHNAVTMSLRPLMVAAAENW